MIKLTLGYIEYLEVVANSSGNRSPLIEKEIIFKRGINKEEFKSITESDFSFINVFSGQPIKTYKELKMYLR